MSARDPLNLVGTTIAEKYLVESMVGEGGFAVVYKAQHLVWKRPVAIKVFRALGNYTEDKRKMLVEAFIQEGALLADLSERSAAIVQARDVGTMTTADGNWMPYMVLEWLEGSTLEQVLESDRTAKNAENAMTTLEPVAEALGLAHAKGIAHRDVKPGNIFLLGDSRQSGAKVKLLDFGIAKVVQDAQKMAGEFNKTGGQITSFTPAYGAPEQFSRTYGATGPWTDVFSLALIFCEIVSGRAALVGDTLPELAYASCDRSRRPTPRTLGANVSDQVEAVLTRALAVSPEERYRTATEFWEALRAAIGLSRTALQVTPPPSSVQRVPLGPPPSFPNVQVQGGPMVGTMDPATTSRRAPTAGAGAAIAVAGFAAVVILGGTGLYFVMRPRPAAPAPSAAVAAPVPPPVASAPAPSPCPTGMVQIPGGKFYMGSDERDATDLERPAHQVTLSPYCMDQYEVTMAAYKACSDKGECKRAGRDNEWTGITKKDRDAFDPLCNAREPEARGQHPVNCVDWTQAQKFCTAMGKRLPTEAEWEFAARGPDGRKFPWGDETPTGGHLNACGKECVAWGKAHGQDLRAMYDADDGFATTAPVGSFAAGKSRYGVYDVVGNVWEWTADWYADYTKDEEKDPKGPASGERRVIRGGAWNGSEAAWVRPTYRYHDVPTKRSYGIGFRCAL
jgi:formylglycine-generating enzyme required for sulfatase activity/serine/threonine protein kinase